MSVILHRMILQSFSWLAVHELIEAAEGIILPVREGVAKPQSRSTGASVSNSVPHPVAMFPGCRFRAHRPGIVQQSCLLFRYRL